MLATNPTHRPETRLVHAGTLRSEFGETSEALFLTQGYVYESSGQAERRFKNEEVLDHMQQCLEHIRKACEDRPQWRY